MVLAAGRAVRVRRQAEALQARVAAVVGHGGPAAGRAVRVHRQAAQGRGLQRGAPRQLLANLQFGIDGFERLTADGTAQKHWRWVPSPSKKNGDG